MLQKIRFIGSVATLYIATIGLAGYLISSAQLFAVPVHAKTTTKTQPKPAPPQFVVVSGKPIRITIPDYGIDLPIDDGIYTDDGEWTLSNNHAQFALMSPPANNHAGNTFVYGHGTDEVFGKIGNSPPRPGTLAHLYTQDGTVFTYRFVESHDLTPNDTGILDDMTSGSPRLTVQTCTGLWSEWRTLFTFAFENVEKHQ